MIGRRLSGLGGGRGSGNEKRLRVGGGGTRTNSRTVRGNVRKTVTSGRNPAAKPT